MKARRNKVFLGIVIVVILIILIVVGAFVVLKVRTNTIMNDYSDIYQNEKYKNSIVIENVSVIEQNISCGYAVIEMFADWCGKNITEEDLYNEYGKVVTSSGNSFADEMNKKFPEYKTAIKKYLTNTEMIDEIYDSLSSGIPVPFEWAALYGDEWTLHYSLITGIDIPNDIIYVANPYGYNEELSISEFVNRTSFEAYEDMPLFFRFAFAFGIFEKNTIFKVHYVTK